MGFLKISAKNNPILIKIFSIPTFIIISILALKFISYFLSKTTTKKRVMVLDKLNSFLMILILIQYFFINNQKNFIMNTILLFTFIYLFINKKMCTNGFVELENSYTKIKTLEIDNKTLNTKYEELSTFHHDFNNIIQTIGSLLLIGKYDNLKRYYKGLKVDCQMLNDMEKLNTTKIKNPEILTLIVNKYELAKQNGIRINLETYSDLSEINSDIFQIVRILGILLDNAIEASKDCDEKNINIEFRLEENTQSIIIENSYSNKDVNTENIFKRGFSTKKGNHGLGLWKVNKIIKNHKNLNLETYKDSEFFTQKLDILIE